MKVCYKTCIFCFFPIVNKYLCMAKRSLLSRCPSYKGVVNSKHLDHTKRKVRVSEVASCLGFPVVNIILLCSAGILEH